jgi:hypothetical protein
MTGAQLNQMGITKLKIVSGTMSMEFDGPFDFTGFDNVCTECNCGGSPIKDDLFWHGGGGGCFGSSHFGLSVDGDVHVDCGDQGGDADRKWGHFHRAGVNTGVYVFGDDCPSEKEWEMRYMMYAFSPQPPIATTPPPQAAGDL